MRWSVKKLSDICTVFEDGDWVESKDQANEGVRLIQTGNVGNGFFKDRGEKARYISEATFKRLKCTEIIRGDCLVSRLPDPVGRACIIPDTSEKMITAVDCTIIRFQKKEILPEWFLFYSLSNKYQKEVNSQISGATRQRISRKNLGLIEIPLPTILEQHRIVAILDDAFATIAKAKANAEQNLINAKEIFESYLQSVFENKGEGWEEKMVGEVAKHSLGKMLDKNKNKGIPQKYLRNQSVRWFEFDLRDLTEMPFLETEKEKYTAIKGDVLICEGGYPGRAAIWNEDFPIYFQKAIHRVRFHKSAYNKWFLYHLYFSDKTGKLKMYFSGTGIQHFTGEALDKYIIPLPPVNKVVSIIQSFDALSAETKKLETIYQTKINNLEELKKSILQKAFNGELSEVAKV